MTSSCFLYTTFKMLNSCVCIDLYLMIEKPFTVHKKRVPFYILLSAFVSVFPLIYEAFWEADSNNYNIITNPVSKFFLEYKTAVWIVLYALAPFAIFHAWRILKNPGMSQEVATLVTKRHIFYIVIFIISNLFVFLNRLLPLLIPEKKFEEWNTPYQVVFGILEILFYVQGISIPLMVVVTERVIYHQLVRNLCQLFCRKANESDNEETLKPILLWLNSARNVELVYTILKGIQT